MLNVQLLTPSFFVAVRDFPAKVSAAAEKEVERLWRLEQTRRGEIFNGRILSALDVTSERILCRMAEYRHLVAQRKRHELYQVLKVRPVAVSGLFQCADGIVFGRRADRVTEEPGLWELVPSGGLDASKAAVGDQVDYRSQILTELREEIGIGSSSVNCLGPLCLVDDSHSHVLDIGVELSSSLSAEAISITHREVVSKEYDQLRVVPLGDVDNFIKAEASQLVAVSKALVGARFMRAGKTTENQ